MDACLLCAAVYQPALDVGIGGAVYTVIHKKIQFSPCVRREDIVLCTAASRNKSLIREFSFPIGCLDIRRAFGAGVIDIELGRHVVGNGALLRALTAHEARHLHAETRCIRTLVVILARYGLRLVDGRQLRRRDGPLKGTAAIRTPIGPLRDAICQRRRGGIGTGILRLPALHGIACPGSHTGLLRTGIHQTSLHEGNRRRIGRQHMQRGRTVVEGIVVGAAARDGNLILAYR